MAEAEVVGVANLIRVRTCGHIACTCKTRYDDHPTEAYVDVNTVSTKDGIFTELAITDDDDREKIVLLPGSIRPETVVERFNECEGPEITAVGIICGAVKGRN
jgi:hypothetical protein